MADTPPSLGELARRYGVAIEYPNWRIHLGGPGGRRLLLEEVLADPRVATLCEALRAAVNTQV